MNKLFKHLRVVITCVVFAFVTVSCSHFDYTITKRSTIDAQIAAARVDTANQLNALNAQQISLLKQVTAEQEARLQATSNFLFNATYTFGTLKALTRPEMVIWQAVQLAAIQLPPVTLTAQNAAIEKLKTDLDEAKVSADALKKQYDDDLAKARTDAAVKDKALTDIAAALKHVDEERVTVLTQANAKEAKLSDARKALDDKDLADKTKELADAARNEALKKWLMAGLGVIALAAAAAAIFVPIPSIKQWGAILAAAAAALAFLVPFVQWYHVLIALLAICLPVGFAIVRAYHLEHADATDTYRALNQVKTQAADTFKAVVAPVLQEWHTDPKTGQRIDATLKAVGDT